MGIVRKKLVLSFLEQGQRVYARRGFLGNSSSIIGVALDEATLFDHPEDIERYLHEYDFDDPLVKIVEITYEIKKTCETTKEKYQAYLEFL